MRNQSYIFILANRIEPLSACVLGQASRVTAEQKNRTPHKWCSSINPVVRGRDDNTCAFVAQLLSITLWELRETCSNMIIYGD